MKPVWNFKLNFFFYRKRPFLQQKLHFFIRLIVQKSYIPMQYIRVLSVQLPQPAHFTI